MSRLENHQRVDLKMGEASADSGGFFSFFGITLHQNTLAHYFSAYYGVKDGLSLRATQMLQLLIFEKISIEKLFYVYC